MKINKHGSFYIRNGWPTKILTAVRDDPHVFSPNLELNAVDELGVGRVMIKALRYWANAMGLVEEGKDSQGIVCLETQLFRDIYENDLYFQNKGTLWLMQRAIAENSEEATAWYWLFNEFSQKTFTKSDFANSFYSYIANHGGVYALSAIEKEFDCVKNTYVSDGKYVVEKIVEEDTIPFFAPLALVKSIGNGRYEKQRTQLEDVPVDIVYFSILKDNERHLAQNKQISIDDLVEKPGQVCRYFNISYASLMEILQVLENKNKIKLFNNFGNRHIEIFNASSDGIIHNFYQPIER